MIKHFIPLFLLPLLLHSVYADDSVIVVGHTYPARITAKELDWTLSGADHFRYRFFSVFTGALYIPDAKPEARRLKFTYTRNLDANTLLEQGMRVLREANDSPEIENRQNLIDQVNRSYQDVSRGDTYTFTVIPDQGTWLHLNDKEILFLEDADFGLWYLNIWLGDKPMSTSLRNALIKGKNI